MEKFIELWKLKTKLSLELGYNQIKRFLKAHTFVEYAVDEAIKFQIKKQIGVETN